MGQPQSLYQCSPKILIVGLGKQGNEHLIAARSLQASGELGAIAVCEKRAEFKAALKPGEMAFSSISEALIFGDYDLAVVAIPNDLHFVTIKQLLLKKIPVLKEKPLALSGDEAKAYDHLSRINSTALIVAQQRRYHPAFQLLKEWLPRIGRARYADYTFCLNDKNNSWYWDKARGGGCWAGLGWHACWLFTFLFGEGRDLTLTRLRGKQVGWTYDTEDTCLLSGFFSENCAIRALLSVTSPVKKEELLLEGTEGVICLSRNSVSLFGANGDRIQHQDLCVNNSDLYVEQLRSTFQGLINRSSGIDIESRKTFENHFRAIQDIDLGQENLEVPKFGKTEMLKEAILR